MIEFAGWLLLVWAFLEVVATIAYVNGGKTGSVLYCFAAAVLNAYVGLSLLGVIH